MCTQFTINTCPEKTETILTPR